MAAAAAGAVTLCPISSAAQDAAPSLRAGYVFAVNPAGARYDGLINPGGDTENADWDGIWDWMQHRLEGGTSQKRRFYTQLTWWFGGFYNGTLDQFQWTGAWNALPLLTIEFTGERNIGTLPAGRFTQSLVGNRLRVNLSPDLSISSYLQYDTTG